LDRHCGPLVGTRTRRTGQAGLLRAFGVCLSIPGDSYLIGIELPDGQPGAGEEEWQVVSPSNVTATGGTVKVKLSPGGRGFDLPEDATLIRVWQEHEQWPLVADSNMRSVLDVCEEILIYARQFRAVGKSRNSAGILLLPNELDFANPTAEPDGVTSPPDGLTQFERGIVSSFVEPVKDDASPSAVAPHMIRGPAEALKEVGDVFSTLGEQLSDGTFTAVEDKHLGREIDEAIIKLLQLKAQAHAVVEAREASR
jgi:hypothetical protein